MNIQSGRPLHYLVGCGSKALHCVLWKAIYSEWPPTVHRTWSEYNVLADLAGVAEGISFFLFYLACWLDFSSFNCGGQASHKGITWSSLPANAARLGALPMADIYLSGILTFA